MLLNRFRNWIYRYRSVRTEIPVNLHREIFSLHQLEQQAIEIALSHRLTKKSVHHLLLKKIAESEAILVHAFQILSDKSAVDSISPASEWLLDNFYLIQEQINTIRINMPKNYSQSLPQLAKTTIRGYPRIYDIALHMIEHSDARLDLEKVSVYIQSYQTITPLTLGELWALPMMLGVSLIVHLSQASQRIVADKRDYQQACAWADRMIEVAVAKPEKLVRVIAEMSRSERSMSTKFIAELTRCLQSSALSLPLSWIEQHLADEGLSTEQVIQEEAKQQAFIQATVRNCIDSLRRLSRMDWKHFVEEHSVVEHVLQKDPANIYNKMDFITRDRYRHAIEKLSKETGISEKMVSETVVQIAKARGKPSDIHVQPNDPSIQCLSHVGYYLIDQGIVQLEKALGLRQTIWRQCRHLDFKWMMSLYFGSIAFLTSSVLYVLLNHAHHMGLSLFWRLLLALPIAIVGSQLAKELVDQLAAILIQPKALPRMNFSEGLPKECRTLVVVPTMLTDPESIDYLVDALEVRFLGNQDQYLHFMLLTDFNDAPHEQMPNDPALIALITKRIEELNQRYSSLGNDIFLLCHRPRIWNEHEHVWMGKERKRGKLSALNQLIIENKKDHFSVMIGNIQLLKSVKYIITLDSDTQLPRESVRQFVATMFHPLNRPIIDKKNNRVVRGYGILQPRIAESLCEKNPTYYVNLFGNEFGIDPYTRTVFDIYQDLFQQGSFVGKGIYDVDTFYRVLNDRLPDNRILSHDLLEGCYLRSGYLSDVPLFEKSPGNYLSDVKRRIRWIRGDWQIISWLFPKVKNKEGQNVHNPLSLLSKIKIFDNLRRSLVPIALMSLFIFSGSSSVNSIYWLRAIVLILFLPIFMQACVQFIRKSTSTSSRQHIDYVLKSFLKHLEQCIVNLVYLPYEAWYCLSAILRTIWRLSVSKKHLLEWTPSDQADHQLKNTLYFWISTMWVGPVIAIVGGGFLCLTGQWITFLSTLPLIFLWFISPLFMRALSQPIHYKSDELSEGQLRYLHQLARKIWSYFETFVTDDDYWLPPDNYQEIPNPVLARRTSPTNIGLYLLSNLTAYDFGYITSAQLLYRIENTLNTVDSLEKYHGHLYNWYSTETLKPLFPRYISTVDSGNWAGHLLTLRQGLLEIPDDPLLSVRYLDGLQDTIDVLSEWVTTREIDGFKQLLTESRTAFQSWSSAILSVNQLYEAANQVIAMNHSGNQQEIVRWTNHLFHQCEALMNEVSLFAIIPDLSPSATLRQIADLDVKDNISREAIDQANGRLNIIKKLSALILMLSEMEMSFLQDASSHLLAIGFNVDDQRRDSGHYDLLASEARLGIYVAIAQGQLLQDSWFALGRLLVASRHEPVLVSWSGSMFEYLMPLLVMPTYPFTLLNQTYHAAVKSQINYGKQRNVPWGLSESGFNAVDSQSNYLYRALGVPGLGLMRGLENELVVAPYASVMALMVEPGAACKNLQRLSEIAEGPYGFYEAIDYTRTRLVRDRKREIVRSFMTHHQGMAFLSLSYLLHQQPMQRRFMSDPFFKATQLLLQERIPKSTGVYLRMPKRSHSHVIDDSVTSMRVFNNPNTQTPQVQLLSNSRYHLMITQAGGGYSRWKNIMLTRWREDSTCDHWGMFGYVRDLDSGEYWSTQYQPTLKKIENFRAVFKEGHAEFSAHTHQLDIHTEIVVSPEDDVELRRIRIHNRSKMRRHIEFTSFFEIVLAPQETDLAHSAFSRLFVETEICSEYHAILAERRSSDDQINPCLFHLLNVYTKKSYDISYETDRVRFVGRHRTPISPIALLHADPLSNASGAVLDPIAAIRCRMSLEPDELVIFDLLTGVTETREKTLAIVEKYQDQRFANRIFGLSWTHSQVILHQLNMNESDAQLYAKLASPILYSSKSRRATPQNIAKNRLGQSSLWRYSISGDLPIVLLYVEDIKNIELVKQLIQAQAYWRFKGLEVDCVILNAEGSSYRQPMHDLIMGLIAATKTLSTEHVSSVYALLVDQVPLEDQILLESVARVVLNDKRGTLREQLNRRRVNKTMMPVLKTLKNKFPDRVSQINRPRDLQFFNGYGGFSREGHEYIIHLSEGQTTPAPWVNILANPHFGTLVSESGQGYTWIENSHAYRLTPWENDSLSDSSGEAFYLRDENTGLFWSPTLLPCRGKGDYQIRHGFGYSLFEHAEQGIHTELCMTVACDGTVKIVMMKIRNDSGRMRQLSAFGCVAWILGNSREKNVMHIVTSSTEDGAILAQNHYNTDFGQRTAFFNAVTSEVGIKKRSLTCDRTEFLGRNGSYQQPAALKQQYLSNKTGAGLDPCGAIQITFDLPAGQTRNIVFLLGVGDNPNDAEQYLKKYQNLNHADEVLNKTQQFWREILSKQQFKTQNPALNLMMNGWLIYQLLSSRLWGRTGYYQSSGAFGFRDQIQDVMSLAQIAPHLLREHLLLCAAHQFEEGDVQHWWHPPTLYGVRTRCSDDYLWLPFAMCHYIHITGDIAIFDENIPFLQGRSLKPDEESYYEQAHGSHESFSLYEHAVRAIQYGLQFGPQGLPLMGSGDWNDGMNSVGIHGRGESVWLGFFLYNVLTQFAPLADQYGDQAFAEQCHAEAARLKQNLHDHAWDGEWYLRAFFDDGTPLGSSKNNECRIDSIVQSWSVISKGADPERAKKAMASVHSLLVSDEDCLMKLFTPPFDHSKPSPGYIQGYLPGIRENGGQYTQAAVWGMMAFALLGDIKTAWKLFEMINPVNHGRTAEEIACYKIEPYVTAGDVYSVSPYAGRGGWSWYTGSAGWLYRVTSEILLGLQRVNGNILRFLPLLPHDWDGFQVEYRFGESLYHITIKQSSEESKLILDNQLLSDHQITLKEDGQIHYVEYFTLKHPGAP